ncbi:MAG: Spy/CpxP family protein refolding chaperone [Myxococcota bacterium]
MRTRSFWHSCESAFDPRFAYAGSARATRHNAREWACEARRFEHRHGRGGGFSGSGLGVRRPLRFLAYRLELSEEQTASLARILEQLKLERAQAELDLRRAASALADAFVGDFGRAEAEAVAEQRGSVARREQDAVAKALEEVHALLDVDQRRELAELIRTGAIHI